MEGILSDVLVPISPTIESTPTVPQSPTPDTIITPVVLKPPEIVITQQDTKPGLFRIARNAMSNMSTAVSNLFRPSENTNQSVDALKTPMSRRTFLNAATGFTAAAAGSVLEQKITQASAKDPDIPTLQPQISPYTEKAVESELSTENIIDMLREYVYGDGPQIPLTAQEKQEGEKLLIEHITPWFQENQNKKGLLLPDQVDESTFYPSYYLDGGSKVTGSNRGTRDSNGTLKWSRDYRPINKYGITFNLPSARVPEELRNIMPQRTRSSQNWWEVVNQFGLDNTENTRYQPDDYTYCNFAARDMLRAFGIGDIPQWFKDFRTGEIKETVTNVMYEQVHDYGTFNYEKYQEEGENAREWIILDKKQAIEYAKHGIPIVLLTARTTGVGHMALLTPTSTDEKLIVAQAGLKTGIVEWDETHYSKANSYKETLFLVHKLDQES